MDQDSKDTETSAPLEPAHPTSSAEPGTELWAVSYSEEEDRELTRAEVRSALERGEINGSTIVWRPGMDDWAPLSETPDFASLVAQDPPAPEQPSAPVVEAPVPFAVETTAAAEPPSAVPPSAPSV